MDGYLDSFYTIFMDVLTIAFSSPVLILVCTVLLLLKSMWYEKRIRYLEITLSSLSKLAGVELNDPALVPPEVRKALNDGHRLKAIRLYRKITGANLNDATEVVDVLLKKA